MFDGTLKTPLNEGAKLARLRQVYDALLDRPQAEIPVEAMAELFAMARM